jgi:hypothetical protein
VELDAVTGESQGSCKGIHTQAYFTPLFLIMLIPPILTARLAWMTRDVDPLYSETRWIFAIICAQFQLLVVAIPLLLLVGGLTTNVRHVGQTTVFACFSFNTMGLLLGPKIYMVHFVGKDPALPQTTARGSAQGGTRVSGLEMPTSTGTTVSRAGPDSSFLRTGNGSSSSMSSFTDRGGVTSSLVRASVVREPEMLSRVQEDSRESDTLFMTSDEKDDDESARSIVNSEEEATASKEGLVVDSSPRRAVMSAENQSKSSSSSLQSRMD